MAVLAMPAASGAHCLACARCRPLSLVQCVGNIAPSLSPLEANPHSVTTARQLCHFPHPSQCHRSKGASAGPASSSLCLPGETGSPRLQRHAGPCMHANAFQWPTRHPPELGATKHKSLQCCPCRKACIWRLITCMRQAHNVGMHVASDRHVHEQRRRACSNAHAATTPHAKRSKNQAQRRTGLAA